MSEIPRTERCHGRTLRRGANTRCKHVTTQGTLCHQHLKKEKGLRITKSELPNAGKGLFTTKDIKLGSIIAQYTGDKIVELDPDYGNPYAIQIKDKPPTYIDASRTNTGEARFSNDARQNAEHFVGEDAEKTASRFSAHDNNAKLVYSKVTKRAYLKATRDIAAGEEIFTNYGDQYWHEPVVKKSRGIMPSRKKPKKPRAPKAPEPEPEPEPVPIPEPEQEIAAPAPKAKKSRKRDGSAVSITKKKSTAKDKAAKRLQKYTRSAIKRLAIIQAIFNSDKIASQITAPGFVKRKTKKEIHVPDSHGMLSGDWQLALEKLIKKEQKLLAAYLKRTYDQIDKMVDSIVQR